MRDDIAQRMLELQHAGTPPRRVVFNREGFHKAWRFVAITPEGRTILGLRYVVDEAQDVLFKVEHK